ncbi:MAG TPA: DUF4255 domain-containing protein, partial [Polyangiaceae bacterium]
MPIGDLSLISTTIVDVIKSAPQFAGPAPTVPVTVTLAGPLDLKTELPSTSHNIITVHLFHVSEDPSSRAYRHPNAGTGPIPVQHAPLALSLYYVINAHDPEGPDIDSRIKMEQRILGIVAKALHDNPTLRVVEPGVTAPEGDPFDIILRPVPIDEAIQFWSSDESQLVRVSLYLEARVVLIEPEKPRTVPGLVLSVNSPILLGLGPQLVSSRSSIAFVAPQLGLRAFNAEPARVAVFDPLALPQQATEELNNNAIVIEGNGFGAGPHYLDLSSRGKTVRLDLNHAPPSGMPTWVTSVTQDKVTLKVWTEIFDHAKAVTASILPGTYTARLIDDEPPRPRSSGEIAFVVIPQILSIVRSSPYVFTLTLSGNYLLDLDPQFDLLLMVGSEVLDHASTSTPAIGEYIITAGNTLVFHRRP